MMEREPRLNTLRRRADDVRMDVLLDAAEIAERRRHSFELAELDRRAADSPFEHISTIIARVLAGIVSGEGGTDNGN